MTAGFLPAIYSWIPENTRTFLYGQDIFIYILIVPLLLMLIRIYFKAYYRTDILD